MVIRLYTFWLQNEVINGTRVIMGTLALISLLSMLSWISCVIAPFIIVFGSIDSNITGLQIFVLILLIILHVWVIWAISSFIQKIFWRLDEYYDAMKYLITTNIIDLTQG